MINLKVKPLQAQNDSFSSFIFSLIKGGDKLSSFDNSMPSCGHWSFLLGEYLNYANWALKVTLEFVTGVREDQSGGNHGAWV